ncbi:hypothetical protein GMDG_05177 [Pseudogymnoascus destructans 20631-21]|uniref:Uncharacterized protein n=1 Tax=Pseudogymnoascus destructans (strain ATCC MYA-4855 / 20631-21) TaxID=658429 RepID=L8FNH4_PSED2|nr:hypothetical protein GMDG_05177 [Pseudogymnoascus destructans 20631-21]
MSQKVLRVGLCKGRPRHREAFLRLARSSRKALSRQIAHAQSQEASDVRGDDEGRKRGSSSKTQLSSISHLDRSED